MNVQTLARATWRVARLACGLGLILAACAGTTFAGGPPPPPGPAPEIDPGSAATALGLLTGGVLMLTDRLRRK
jgi:hypothetical protein